MNYRNARHKMSLSRSLVAVAAGMCLAGVVMAQSTTGSIYGSVPPGTVVVVTSTTGITRTVTAGADGRYSIANLPSGNYKVEAKGVGSREATVTIGGGTVASFVTSMETVSVTGTRLSAIDTTQVDSRTVFTAETLSKIAVGQSLNQVALLAPGVINSSSYNSPGSSSSNDNPLGRAGMANIGSFGGAAASENAYYINGFPVTNPLTNLGGTSLGFDSIGQVQVLTGGYGAEYGRSTGGVLNIVTKQGTNDFKGGVYYIWTPSSLRSAPKDLFYANTGHWNSANHYNTTAGNNSVNWTDGTMYRSRSKNTTDTFQYGAYASGPIIKDRLFFYVNAEETQSQVNGVRATRLGSATSTDTAAQGWKESLNTYPRSTLKTDWNITDDHRLEFTSVRDDAREAYAYYGFDYSTLSHNNKSYSGNHVLADNSRLNIAKYTGNLTDKLSLSALIGRQTVNHNPDPLSGYNASIPYVSISSNVVPTAFSKIANQQPYSTITDPSKDQTKGYRLDLTYVLGKHELRAGYDHFTADSYIGVRNTGPGGVEWTYGLMSDPKEAISAGYGIGAPANYGGYGASGYYVIGNIYSTGGTVSTEQAASYIEDRWQVTDRFLLSLGFRSDNFTNYNGDHKPYVEQKKNNAPRLGFSWDVNGNASLKVYGNAGRYFLALPNNVAIRAANASLNANKYYTYDSIAADGTPVGLHAITPASGSAGLCPTGTVGAGGTSSNLECGNAPDPNTVAIANLKPHYQDEYSLGFEQALSKQWTWGAKLTYRDLKSAIDDVCPDECRIFNPGEDATFLLANGDGTYTKQYYSTADLRMPKLKRKYVALDMFTDYQGQGGRWYAKVEYTLSHNFGNAEGQLNSAVDTGDGGQADVSVTQDWDQPELMEGTNGNLANNRTHQIKAFGFYKLNDEWRVGGSAIVQSGRPRNCYSYYPYAKKGIYNGAYYNYCGVPGAQTAVNDSTVVANADYKYTPRGTMGNTPWTKTINVSVTYTPTFVKGLSLQADIMNIFNSQVATAYYERSASSRSTVNPRYGQALYYTDPRSVRLTGRYDF